MPDPRTTAHGSFLMPSLEHATVGDAMHPGILSCDPDATLTDVARIMATHHVHCVAVLGASEEQSGPVACGIITDLDLVRAGIGDGSEATARGLALEAIVVEASTPLREAAREMLTRKARHVVVADPVARRPVGVLSTLDVAGVLAWGEA